MASSRNDERRYQVFVSSTYTDLAEERQEVIATLLEMDAFPAGMELFPAADDDAWTLIKRVIDESDYYLLIIGGRYGSVTAAKLGYTEMEFDYAISVKKPVMAFLHADPDSISAGKSEKSGTGRKRLEEFRAKVEKSKHVKFWSTKDELAGKVARTFSKFVRDYPAVGWTRAEQSSDKVLKELAEARVRIADLESEKAVSAAAPPPGSEELAQGSDPVQFVGWLTYDWIDPDAQYNRTKSGGAWISIKLTWDQVFAAVSTRMLDEADEKALNETLSAWSLQELWQDVQDQALEKFTGKEKTKRSDSMRSMELSIDDDAFGVVILQLVALGLIHKSEKRRSVRDSGTYWALTPYGIAYATRLRARRKGSAPAIHTINTDAAASE